MRPPPPRPRPTAAPPAGQLALGALAAGLLAVLMGWVALRHGAPFGVDSEVHGWVVAHRTAVGDTLLTATTATGDDAVPWLLAAGAGLLGAAARGGPPRRWWRGAALGAAALPLAQLLRYGLVTALDRPRPPREAMVHVSTGPALPSGHTSTSALVAIGLAVALLPHCRRALTRCLAVAVPAVWAVAVGVSRVYLGVHWATDVLAGWLYAVAVSCLVLPPLGAALDRLTREGAGRPRRPSHPRDGAGATPGG